MIVPRQFSSEFAILFILAFSASLVFPGICPVAGVSRSAVHGTATALRSATVKLRIWLILTLANGMCGGVSVCRTLSAGAVVAFGFYWRDGRFLKTAVFLAARNPRNSHITQDLAIRRRSAPDDVIVIGWKMSAVIELMRVRL